MSQKKGLSISQLLQRISQANDAQINDIIQAVVKRRKALHPQEELLVLSLPCSNPQERERALEEVFSYIKKQTS